jgi:hypothetical protein
VLGRFGRIALSRQFAGPEAAALLKAAIGLGRRGFERAVVGVVIGDVRVGHGGLLGFEAPTACNRRPFRLPHIIQAR